MSRDELLERLTNLIISIGLPHPTRVAVDGFSASGKTRLADDLAERIEGRGREVVRASLDNFKRPWSESHLHDRTSGEGYYRNAFEYDEIRTKLLEPLGPGGSRKYRSAYIDPLTQTRFDGASGIAADNAVVLADAVFLFRPELDDLRDFRIFVDIGFDLVLERGVSRDAEWAESREAAEELYETRYIPSEQLYVSEVNPKLRADVITDNRDFENPKIYENPNKENDIKIPPQTPENLARNTIEMRGEAGEAWIENLPAIVAECEGRWSLTVGEPFPNLSYNFAAPARRADGTPAVLKLSFPGEKEFETEAEALKIFDGRGIARLLELDLEIGAMLLERLEPGESLEATEDDDEATAIAAVAMRKLWRPAPPNHPFPTVAGWSKGFERLRASFDGGTGPMPTELVERAEKLFGEHLATEESPVLLHGDLHHGNILSSSRGWLAIDPKGVVGERAYETAAMLHNPAGFLERDTPEKLLERRIEILSERLGLERSRIRGWGVAQSVLAAYWSLEDGFGVWEEALAFARLMSKISG